MIAKIFGSISLIGLLGVLSCSAMPENANVTSVRFSVSKVIWPYPVSIEALNDSGLTESRSKAVCLVVVTSEDLKPFEKKADGSVTAFVSFLGPKKAPHVGDRYLARFKRNELWKINMPLNPKEPPSSFVVLDDALSLEKVATK